MADVDVRTFGQGDLNLLLEFWELVVFVRFPFRLKILRGDPGLQEFDKVAAVAAAAGGGGGDLGERSLYFVEVMFGIITLDDDDDLRSMRFFGNIDLLLNFPLAVVLNVLVVVLLGIIRVLVQVLISTGEEEEESSVFSSLC